MVVTSIDGESSHFKVQTAGISLEERVVTLLRGEYPSLTNHRLDYVFIIALITDVHFISAKYQFIIIKLEEIVLAVHLEVL